MAFSEIPLKQKMADVNGDGVFNMQSREAKDSILVESGSKVPESGEKDTEANEELLEEKINEIIVQADGGASDLISQGQVKLEAVEQSLDLSTEDIAETRREAGILERLEKIRNDAYALASSFKGKLLRLVGKTETPDPQRKDYTQSVKYNTLKEQLERRFREVSRPVMEEARRKRDELLADRGLLQMSKEEFQTYFASGEFDVRADLQQQNVADCYAVAAIHAMSCSPHFEMICRSSMKRLPDGSWEVKIPLLSDDGEVIRITTEDLSPQKNKQFLKKGKSELLDFRRKLRPVQGKEGLQALEAAYIKSKFGNVDRLASEYGDGADVLVRLGGEKFVRYQIDSAVKNEETGKDEYPGLISTGENEMAYLDHYLENFDPDIHIAT